jgi:hypothetical protein
MTQDIDLGKLAEQINDKADRDLWNTVPNVWDNTLNTSQITNCITEIPQDIKLELNNGTLTLKAGSKVYVPNGSGVFDTATITSDMQISPSSYASSKHILCVLPNNTIQLLSLDTQQYSGSTAPSGQPYMFWYDTANNYVKYTTDSGSTWQSGWCLPLAIVMITNGTGVTSIDQVFNGFGYIGSTAFSLPGVKGLIPNGRNADGSLKNIELTLDKVVTRTITWNNSGGQELFIGKYTQNGSIQFISTGSLGQIYQQENEPSLVRYNIWYKPSENKVYRCDLDSNGNLFWKDNFPCYIGQWFTSATSPYPITKLTIGLPFHAVDWNDYARELNGKQDISNLSQTLDDSTTKYPSNKAVKTAIDAKDSLPSQSGQSGKFLTTNGTTASWGTVDLTSKANVALDNVSAAGKANIVGWGMPDYTAGVSMASPYTATKSGFIIGIHNLSDNGVRSLTINGIVIYNNSTGAKYLSGQSAGFEYAVAKGDVISWTNFNKMTFYPCK